MTTLVAWLSYQNGRASAISLASDSRFTWNSKKWDFGRKIFFCNSSPDLFGYAADTVLGTNLLSQIISYLDAVSSQRLRFWEKHLICRQLMSSATSGYFNKISIGLELIHCGRDSDGSFAAVESRFITKTGNWQHTSLELDQLNVSQKGAEIFGRFGSGRTKYKNNLDKRVKIEGSLSRSAYQALFDLINSGADPATGGAIQMASLSLTGNVKPIGYFNNNERYLFGIPIKPCSLPRQIEWRNERFEFVDPMTGQPRTGAQRHF